MSDQTGDEPLIAVGIGASAGGLDALNHLLPDLALHGVMTYIVAQHLDPAHPTILADLLARCTEMPVAMLLDDTLLAPDHVYVLPADRALAEIDGGRVKLVDDTTPSVPRHTIDAMFATLAETFSENSVGIILSGTGSDGEQGARAIKAGGGLVFAQDPSSAAFLGMPQAVIAADLADFVLEPQDIARELTENVARRAANKGADGAGAAQRDIAMHDLLEVLTKKAGFDFQQYRETTLRRRIDRRMAVHRLTSFKDYRDLVETSDNEAALLLKDVFITVTSFFRDQETFSAIRHVLGNLLQRKTTNDAIRIWVPGCATGEEAFSIAMLLAEEAGERLPSMQVQVFATDVDESAIATARKSVYLMPQIEGIPKALLDRYFDDLNGAYRVKNDLRDLVIFARHDLMQDPPFNHLDMITCRNVLIYFKRPLQERLISLFHYSLEPGGHLVLGTSESVGKSTGLFEVVNKRLKLFARIGAETRPPTVLRTSHIAARQRLATGRGTAGPMSLEDQAKALLLEGYGPSGVLVNKALRVEYVRGDVSRFLRLAPGEANLSVIDMAAGPLRLEIRLALQKAQRERVPVRGSVVKLKDAIGHAAVTPVVVPTPPGSDEDTFSLLLFEARELVETEQTQNIKQEAADFRVRELEQELAATREHLQTNIEELEASNEELQSINEEFQSTTEELQSANEEFQTTNEELQSTNEELQTVNDELKTKSEELAQANVDLQNILNAALSGVVVLDDQLRVTRYSSASKEIFKVWPTSIGKPLTGSDSPLDLTIIAGQIEQALQSGETLERDLSLGDKLYTVKMIPLGEAVPKAGLMITFDDVTLRKQIEGDSRRLAAVVRDANDAVIVHDFDGSIRAWNRAAQLAYGFTESEATERNIFELVPEDLHGAYRDVVERLKLGERLGPMNAVRRTKDHRSAPVQLTLTLLRDDLGQPAGIATTERLLSMSD